MTFLVPHLLVGGGGTLEVLQILITLGLLEIYLSLLTVTTLIMDNITIRGGLNY